MQILRKRSKILLIAVTITMLIAVGVTFAMWDTSVVKATNGDLSNYANAEVGGIVAFGRYYQTGIKDNTTGEYEKTPIEWIVVDKDERTGQLTLMSKDILASGGYFGNYYYDSEGNWASHYMTTSVEVGGVASNQSYVESTVRAFLNNLERRDLGGDSYTEADGYRTSITDSKISGGKLLTSIGYSNKKFSFNSVPYQRPINREEYKNRPATRGFFDEAFTKDEKAMIMPKVISGYIGWRWPSKEKDPTGNQYVEGSVDKVWLASAAELNIMSVDEAYPNSSDEASTTVFKYFKDKSGVALENALKSVRSPFVVNNTKAMNYSIPLYEYQSTKIIENIHEELNSLDYYWTRSPVSNIYTRISSVNNLGKFRDDSTSSSRLGVRPCIILKY